MNNVLDNISNIANKQYLNNSFITKSGSISEIKRNLQNMYANTMRFLNNFDVCLQFVLEQEKGFVDNPKDPGGNGAKICAEVWVNELRMSDFDEKGGWAATARVTAGGDMPSRRAAAAKLSSSATAT